jgi:hypothetical protein
MAHLQIAGGQLELHLTTAERLESVHSDPRVPLAAVQTVEVIKDAHQRAGIGSGVKAGTRIPGVIEAPQSAVSPTRSVPRSITTLRAACASCWTARSGTSGSSDVLTPRTSQPLSPALCQRRASNATNP